MYIYYYFYLILFLFCFVFVCIFFYYLLLIFYFHLTAFKTNTPTVTTRVFLSSSAAVVSKIVLVILSGVLSISTLLPQKVYIQTHQKAYALVQGLNGSAGNRTLFNIFTNKTFTSTILLFKTF